MDNLNAVNITMERIHASDVKHVIAALRATIKDSGLPMRVSITRVPQGRGELDRSRVIIKGDAFNFTGSKLLRDKVTQIRNCF